MCGLMDADIQNRLDGTYAVSNVLSLLQVVVEQHYQQ